jgi:molybdopterin synthase catalytic subunit
MPEHPSKSAEELPDVLVTNADFDIAILHSELAAQGSDVGAVATFVGLVRDINQGDTVFAMELESYPGMTERSIQAIIDEARGRWVLSAVRVVHRIGKLLPGDQIVYVGVASLHRGEAFAACEFIMDYLKTRAPFWKKESIAGQERWVESRQTDEEAAKRW